jgi:hypothetical protein
MPGNEYGTAAFGKWHLTPDGQQGPARPFGRWPNGWGFDYFYGFLGGRCGLTCGVMVICGLVGLFIAASRWAWPPSAGRAEQVGEVTRLIAADAASSETALGAERPVLALSWVPSGIV